MSAMTAPVLLVGSVPGDTAEAPMRLCAEHLGGLLPAMPDGEPGPRGAWINFLAYAIYDPHPDLVTVHRPRIVPGKPDWMPKGYDDHWRFRVADAGRKLRFDHLGYAREAIASYGDFRRLRDSGKIGKEVRFQVSMPLTEDGARPFAEGPADYEIMAAAYEDAMVREIGTMTAAIPAGDLAIQWDMVFEVTDIEARPDNRAAMPWFIPAGDPMARYRARLQAVSAGIPAETLLGIHICYGDLGHRHLIEPSDLGVCVAMANAAVASAGRRLDFVHMPVPRGRHDDDYFKPLADLRIGDAKLYAGLIHHTDGVDGALKRLSAFRKYFRGNAGISTECGFGRRDPQSIPALLDIHRMVAAAL